MEGSKLTQMKLALFLFDVFMTRKIGKTSTWLLHGGFAIVREVAAKRLL